MVCKYIIWVVKGINGLNKCACRFTHGNQIFCQPNRPSHCRASICHADCLLLADHTLAKTPQWTSFFCCCCSELFPCKVIFVLHDNNQWHWNPISLLNQWSLWFSPLHVNHLILTDVGMDHSCDHVRWAKLFFLHVVRQFTQLTLVYLHCTCQFGLARNE